MSAASLSSNSCERLPREATQLLAEAIAIESGDESTGPLQGLFDHLAEFGRIAAQAMGGQFLRDRLLDARGQVLAHRIALTDGGIDCRTYPLGETEATGRHLVGEGTLDRAIDALGKPHTTEIGRSSRSTPYCPKAICTDSAIRRPMLSASGRPCRSRLSSMAR
jgi:hypothetical protein